MQPKAGKGQAGYVRGCLAQLEQGGSQRNGEGLMQSQGRGGLGHKGWCASTTALLELGDSAGGTCTWVLGSRCAQQPWVCGRPRTNCPVHRDCERLLGEEGQLPHLFW